MSKLAETFSRLNVLFEGRRKYFAIGGLLVVIVAAILLLRGGDKSIRTADRTDAEATPGAEGTLDPGIAPTDGSGATGAAGTAKSTAKKATTPGARPGVGVAKPKSGTIPPGVDYAKQTIKVAYYWGDSSRSSQYLPPGTAGDTVDDGKAFSALVGYINKHAKGSAQLMGTKIGLGNWLIEPTIVTMNDADAINSGTTHIAKELKPFAAITARGSLGTETCPSFAAAGIHNFATLQPYEPNIGATRGGYCVPTAISWDQQIDATVNYMNWHKTTKLQGPRTSPTCAAQTCDRVYGFIYSEYPGLDKQGPIVADRLGIPAARRRSMPAGLSNAASVAPGVRDALRAEGVNTVIMPDAGAALAFTHAANDWYPDYYVWPCSGQDTTGYTKLLPPDKWDNASGLTCYDDTFDADLTIDADDRQTQWYAAYKEMAPNSEAPSPTYLVYGALQPLVEGVSRLGNRDFTVENFRAALKEFQPYRYNGITGRTNDGPNILLRMGNSPDASIWGDMARVSWSPAAQNPYSYSDAHRYTSNQSFP